MHEDTATLPENKYQRLQHLGVAAAWIVASTGIIVLLGWQYQFEPAKRIFSGLVSMNPVTAFLFVLSGVALTGMIKQNSYTRYLTKPLAVIIASVGFLRILNYLLSRGFAIDEMFYKNDLVSLMEPIPNRMAPTTAVSFFCVALAFLFSHPKSEFAQGRVQALACFSASIALFAIVGYLYGISSLTSLSPFIPMALHTALAFLILSLGILLARPRGGFFGIQSRFVWKLYAGYLSIILFTTIIIGFLIDKQIERQLLADSQRLLKATAVLVAETKGADLDRATSASDLRKLIPTNIDFPVQLTIFARDGKVISDSDADPSRLNQNADASRLEMPEIRAALNGADGIVVTRARSQDGRQFMYVAHPFKSEGAVLGFVRAGISLEVIASTLSQIRTRIFVGTIIGVFLAMIVAGFFAKRVTALLFKIARSAQAIAHGDLSQNIQVSGTDEIATLGNIFNQMRQKLIGQMDELKKAQEASEAATKAKSLFISHMSHEIRTPLNGVIGMLDMLQRTELNPKQRRYMDVAKASGDALVSLINDILDLSKIQAGKLELESVDFDIYELIESSIEVVAQPASDKHLEIISHIQPDVPRKVRGDPNRLRQILVNLVGNAVKFTAQGEVLVRVFPVSIEGEKITLRFDVSDTGIGIPAESIPKLFQSFTQVDTSITRTFGGTGLGLAISKDLVTLLKGTIGLQSELGKGSTFWFTLPFTARVQSGAIKNLPDDPRAMKVLIIDDNKSYRTLLTEHIASWGMQVTAHSDSQSALREIERRGAEDPPHVILIDKDIAGENGLELGTAIKQKATANRAALIALLSLGEEVSAAELKAKGFHGHISKPVRRSKLFDSIMDGMAVHWGDEAVPSFSLQTPIPAPATRGLHILLVEDNIANQIVAGEILSYLGHKYEIASNGQLALNAIEKERYDLILMDCQMPGMDGYETANRIREWEQSQKESGGAKVPIVALTANATSGDRERCFAAGMDEYCTKPIDPDLLAKIIGTLVPASKGSVHLPGSEPSTIAGEDGAPFDLGALLSRVKNNFKVVDQVLVQFEQQIRDTLEKVDVQLFGGSIEKVANLMHALRGAAALVVATSLIEIAKRMEKAAREENFTAVKSDLEEFKREANLCLAYIPKARNIVSLKASESQNIQNIKV